MNKINNLKMDVTYFVVDEVSGYLEMMGAKKMIGRIFGLLMTQDEALSLKEISDMLHVSKPAASQALNQALQVQLIKKVHVKEFPRENFFKLEVDFMQMMIDPGLKKLSVLRQQVAEAVKIMEKEKNLIGKDEELSKLYKRLSYIRDALKIVIEEYEVFGERINDRLNKMKKSSSI